MIAKYDFVELIAFCANSLASRLRESMNVRKIPNAVGIAATMMVCQISKAIYLCLQILNASRTRWNHLNTKPAARHTLIQNRPADEKSGIVFAMNQIWKHNAGVNKVNPAKLKPIASQGCLPATTAESRHNTEPVMPMMHSKTTVVIGAWARTERSAGPPKIWKNDEMMKAHMIPICNSCRGGRIK